MSNISDHLKVAAVFAESVRRELRHLPADAVADLDLAFADLVVAVEEFVPEVGVEVEGVLELIQPDAVHPFVEEREGLALGGQDFGEGVPDADRDEGEPVDGVSQLGAVEGGSRFSGHAEKGCGMARESQPIVPISVSSGRGPGWG